MTFRLTRAVPACALVLIISSFLPVQSGDNTLSDQEKKEGWKLLFDGKSTKGWRTYNNKPAAGWQVKNGEIHCRPGKIKSRADLITVDQYGDFELAVDWKIDKSYNSGIMYRVVETDRPAYETGPEYQLIDDAGYPDKLDDNQKSGADYAMHPPAKFAAKPAGEYNHTVIRVKGAHVEHWLNGEKVVDFELWTPEWDKLKAASKWKDAAGYGMAKSGYVALQDHNGGVWFKNVKIRPL